MVKRNEGAAGVGSVFAVDSHDDAMAEQNMSSSKALPEIAESQQWEEGGVNWSKAADGTLSYYDEASGTWLVYQQ